MVNFISPEIELLICCARTKVDALTADRIKELVQKKLDWEYLYKIAIQQGVLPLLYKSLKEICPADVPSGTIELFQSLFIANAKRNLFLASKLLKILELLKRQGILAIPFKGPVLTENVYGDLSLRRFSDLDILIYEHDAIRAYNLLISQGYKPEIRLKDTQFKVYQKTQDQISVVRNDIRLIVELHWGMVGRYSSFPFDLGSLRERLELVTFAGKKVFHLSSEELLLYLCIHGAQHCWENLDMICCVAELIRSHPDIDWIRVLHLARRIHCEKMFFLGLYLAYDLLGANIPVQVQRKIKSAPKIKKLVEVVYYKLFHKSKVSYRTQIKSRFSFFHIEVRESFLDRIRYGLHLLMDPTMKEWRLLPLPANFSFIHYLFRPIRLVIGLVLIFLRRLNKNLRLNHFEIENHQNL